MERPFRPLEWVPVSVFYVLGSTVLGLATVIAMEFETFFWVWGSSVVADVVFVLGTVGAGWAACYVATRTHYAASLVPGFLLNWVVYAWSFSLLGGVSSDFDMGDTGNVFGFVFRLGWPGLLFSSVAPGVFMRLTEPEAAATPTRSAS